MQVNRPIDLCIFNGNTASAKPAVIIEAKSPTNVAEMFSAEHPNVKSLQELVYYFMLEYVHSGNREIKWLAITNFDEWYFFDVKDFIRYFGNKTKPIYDQFLKFKANQMSGNKTSDFYNDIAKPAIDDFLKSCDINVVHFNLKDACKNIIAQAHDRIGSAMKHASGSAALASHVIASEAKQSNTVCHPERSVSGFECSKKLLSLYKFLSPETLLAKSFANDSNSLDRNFYVELLQIIGLEEVKEEKGGKKVIRRKNPANRDKASLLESAIYQLEDDFPNKEECEAMALRLCITWVNRLLFLKLVESQILMYQKGDASYRFMNTDKIANFDELNIFFFKVLGKKIEDRDEDVLKRYPNVPYLNSSLFEPTEDEKRLAIRDEVTIRNKFLASSAKAAGVETPVDYAVFQNRGYQGLYNGLGMKDIHKRKGLKKNEQILDHMGATELAANLFRITQTDDKLRRENIKGKEQANETHYAVGKKVRQTIAELGGTMPENLPTPKISAKKLKQERKKAIAKK